MSEYTKEQVEQFKRKADKWDLLGDKIARCYPEYDKDSGEELESQFENEAGFEAGLEIIGEMAASAFGWL
jgi:hypothetical protein